MTTKMEVGGIPQKTMPTTALVDALTGVNHLSSMTADPLPGGGKASFFLPLFRLLSHYRMNFNVLRKSL